MITNTKSLIRCGDLRGLSSALIFCFQVQLRCTQVRIAFTVVFDDYIKYSIATQHVIKTFEHLVGLLPASEQTKVGFPLRSG